MTTPAGDITWRREGVQTKSDLPLRHLAAPARSIYIHVPFCFHKCHYCDFYSFVDNRDQQEAYLLALLTEISRLDEHNRGAGPFHAVETIFVGGGTPSLLRPDLWARLLDHLRATFTPVADSEFTVECNPETVTPELMRTLAAGGVNRISIGAQSFHPRHLATLERHHNPANVERALQLARDAGIKRLSVDLIFGIPGQTLTEWEDDLTTALALVGGGLAHISCYALTYEPGTAMTRRLELGHVTPVDEDTEADMFEHTVERLRDAGLERYEVSNFARPGEECRHNLVYWRQGQWLAAGPSASGHVGGVRWKNVPRLGDWMAGVNGAIDGVSGYSPVTDVEHPDARRAFAERLLMGLRLAEGLAVESLRDEAIALGTWEALEGAASSQVDAALLCERGGRWALTDRGYLFADTVIGALMHAVRPGGA